MNFRRTLLPVALVALAVLFGGCTRGHARRDVARDLRAGPSQPSRELARDAVAAPIPPTPPPLPPAEPPVAPPRTDTLSGIVPPMPDGGPTPLTAAEPPAGVPTTVPDSPVVQASGVADAESEADRKKRQERREERKQRREDRQEPPAAPAPQPPAAEPLTAPAPVPPATDSAADVRKLVNASARRYADVPDFECRLVSQEIVNGKQLPRNEIEYRFRQKPLSVYMKTLSEAGQGREVMYVQGKFDNQIHLVTGKGDNRLVGTGFKTSMDPDDSRATAKSRYRIYEAGLGRTIKGLQGALESQGTKGGCAVKALGPVKRPESPYPLEGVEVTTSNSGSAVIAGGGTRQVFFDPKPDSPSYLLPVLVVTKDLAGREVEYYSFTRFKIPAGTTDADWNPSRLGK